LKNFAEKIKLFLDKDIANVKGSGAAGGAAAGLIAFFDAKLVPGAEILMELTGFNGVISKKSINLLITGEGEINYQTAFGKLPVSVAMEAKKYNITTVAVVGKIGQGAFSVHEKGIDCIFSIMDKPMSQEAAMENSRQLLYETIGQIFRFYYNARINKD
jgi:glycerate 2-kinase